MAILTSLHNSIKLIVTSTIMFMKAEKAIYDILLTTYTQQNVCPVYSLYEDIFNLKQND